MVAQVWNLCWGDLYFIKNITCRCNGHLWCFLGEPLVKWTKMVFFFYQGYLILFNL